MKEYKDIPIFQYGLNPNNVYISKEVLENALHSFADKPSFEYNENDKYNKDNPIIGKIEKVTRTDDKFVYGNVIIFTKEEEINNFRNYEISVENIHQDKEDKTKSIVDDFTLNSISFDFKKEEKESE